MDKSNIATQRDTFETVVPLKKVTQFRESRADLPADSKAVIEFNDYYGEKHTARLVNVSRFGARIETTNADLPIQMGSALKDVRVLIEDATIYTGQFVVVNSSPVGANSVSYGLTLEAGQIDLDQVRAILELSHEYESFQGTKKILEISQLVKPEFKVLCADLNTLFQDLRTRLLAEEGRILASNGSDHYKERMSEHAVTVAMSLYLEDIHGLFHKFKVLTDTFSKDETVVHKRYFRANFHPLTIGSPFVGRGYQKPLGYAGDYGLMLMLYEYKDAGGNLFEKFFHRFSCSEPAAVANKNRVEFLSEVLMETYSKYGNDDDFKVTSVACGPAREMQLFSHFVDNSHGAKIDLIMIDQEANALDWSQTQLRPLTSKKKIKTTFLQEDAVLGIIKERDFVKSIDGSKVIISAGLFDYLSDRVATRLISSLFDRLAPGGLLLVGNVSKENPDRFSMDFFAEWNLILRSKEDMLSLVPEDLRINKKCRTEVVSESLGLNLFLKITKL